MTYKFQNDLYVSKTSFTPSPFQTNINNNKMEMGCLETDIFKTFWEKILLEKIFFISFIY